MTWDNACAIARVRMLAIAAEVRAGGRPGEARMRHAIAPIGDHFAADLGAAGRAAAIAAAARRRRSAIATEL